MIPSIPCRFSRLKSSKELTVQAKTAMPNSCAFIISRFEMVE